tara:strand:+ start:221 stop:661 length:441 start_codon:yes stop_codon:yes gene_type:complete
MARTRPGKLPFWQLYLKDVQAEAVYKAPADTFGAYMRLLIEMHQAQPRGIIQGTSQFIRTLAGVEIGDWARVFGEIEMAKCFDIVVVPADQVLPVLTAILRRSDGNLTAVLRLSCRRMLREEKAHKKGLARQLRYDRKQDGDGQRQ